MKKSILFTLIFLLSGFLLAQPNEEDKGITQSTLSALKWRNIGPAFASGRIADIAVHPDHEHTWYVAVGSGGVWRTTNSGITWKPAPFFT